MKVCSKCNVEKEEHKFEKKDKTRGYGGVCKECRNKYRKTKIFNEVTVSEYKCWSCDIIKSSDLFNKCKRNPQGINGICRECQSLRNKKRYEENKEEIKKKTLEHYYKNHTEVRKSRKGYASKRCKVDIKFKLSRRLRSRLYDALRAKSWKKTTKFYDYIGCSLDELKHHLESQFTTGMSWDNYGKWHIDHITPLSSADTAEEMYKLCHYTNLQPLWAEDNIKKGCKV